MSNIPSFSEHRKRHESTPANSGPAELSWVKKEQPSNMAGLLGGRLGILIFLGIVSFGLMFAVSFKSKEQPKEAEYLKNLRNATAGKQPLLPDQKHGSDTQTKVDMVNPDGTPLQPQIAKQSDPNQEPEAPETPAQPQTEPEEAKTETPETPTKEATPEAPKPSERTVFTRQEAQSRAFREPLADFKPLENLDPTSNEFKDAYEQVIDEDIVSFDGLRDASKIDYAAKAIYLMFRFLRTHQDNPEKLKEYEKERNAILTEHLGEKKAEATHFNVMNMPYPHRGQPFHFQGNLLKKYRLRYWGGDDQNHSGVQDTWMLLCRGPKYKHYAVIVPHDVKHLTSRDEADLSDNVSWHGLFLQRWSYVRQHDNQWDAMPVYVALKAKRLPPPDTGMSPFMWIFVAVGIGGLFLVMRLVRRDQEKSERLRKELIEKRAEFVRKKRKEKATETQPSNSSSQEDGNASMPSSG